MAMVGLRYLAAMTGAGALAVLGVASAQPASPPPFPPASAAASASASAAPPLAATPVASASGSAPLPVAPSPTVVTYPPVAPVVPFPPGNRWPAVPVHGYGSGPRGTDGITLRNAGIGIFLTTYGLTVIGSGIALGMGRNRDGEGKPTCTESTPWGFLPLVGPFILAGGYPNYQKLDAEGGTAACADHTAPVVAGAVIAGLAQITGAALMIAGLAISTGSTDGGASVAIDVRAMPAGGAGLAIEGTF